MSVRHWLYNTKERFKHDPIEQAVKTSLDELRRGVHERVVFPLTGDIVRTTLAGERLNFVAENRKQLVRAQTLHRERPVLEWLCDAIEQETVFWDIGSYHGHYSVVAASKGAIVVAFEPHPDNYDRLQTNLGLNGLSAKTENVALSNTNSTMALSGDVLSEQQVGEHGRVPIETRIGDSVWPWPDVVKIDVEGHETAVLDGMRNSLQHLTRIAIEIHGGEDQRQAVERKLEAAGLEVSEIDNLRGQTYIGGEQPQ